MDDSYLNVIRAWFTSRLAPLRNVGVQYLLFHSRYKYYLLFSIITGIKWKIYEFII